MQTYEEKMAETNRIEALGQAWLDANAPKDFKAWIVAELEENQSDLMTDYHGSKTVAKIPLAFSKHTRNLFPEMRKAAAKYDAPGLKVLAESKPGEYENRQTWSMGAGMFLGANRYHGWKVRKMSGEWGTRDLAIKIGEALEKGERLPIMGDAVVAVPQPAPIDTTTTRNAARAIQAVPCSVEQNHERNGVEIKFSEKPSAEDRQTLRNNGFRWSRFNSVWWAVATEESLAFAETLIPEPEAEVYIAPYVSPADFTPERVNAAPFFVTVKCASLNKNNTIEEYEEECSNPQKDREGYSNWTIGDVQVDEVWQLTPASTWEVITEAPSFEPAMFSAATPEAIADRAISIAQKIAQVLNDKPELVKAGDNEIVRQYLQLQLLPVLA
jgi:hypothetical protein